MKMNWLDKLNQVIEYMEEHLEDEIDYTEIANIFGYSVYHVQRIFAMVAGVPCSEYIRNRKLSMAAMELQSSHAKVIDVAMKYGYSSPNSFHRAFKAFHGVAPSDIRKEGVIIKAYPPLFFNVEIKGAHTMEYRILQMNSFRIVGKRIHTTMENGACYRDTPLMWKTLFENQEQLGILSLNNNEPIGLLGVSKYSDSFTTGSFDYYIGCASDRPTPEGMHEYEIPKVTWAVFPCKNIKASTIQQLENEIVMEWLPTSGYEYANAPDIELYREDGTAEIWMPIKKR